jgi:crooked neck
MIWATVLKVGCFLVNNRYDADTESPKEWTYVFPDDEKEAKPGAFKLLQMAHAWKQAQAQAAPPARGRSNHEDEDVEMEQNGGDEESEEDE